MPRHNPVIPRVQLSHALPELGRFPAALRRGYVAIAGYMKLKRLCRNGWLAERLGMGSESGVSRYVSQMQSGGRKGRSTG
ncbi:hypothetical protein N8787_04095 [Opitutaceae bacterium]|nr:hypothetical protein [Opitutaceae bacterium]